MFTSNNEIKNLYCSSGKKKLANPLGILINILFFMMALILPIFANAATSSQSRLTVNFTGLENNEGVVRIILYNSPQSYNDQQHAAQVAYRLASAPISNQQASYTFDNLPYGSYSIIVFHDVDQSGKLKRNFIGIPQEEIGFSNNPLVKKTKPTFEQTKFEVNQPKEDIAIKLIKM